MILFLKHKGIGKAPAPEDVTLMNGRSIPLHALVLKVRPVINIQEHTHMFTYWEGAAFFTGKGMSGQDYVELTGY